MNMSLRVPNCMNSVSSADRTPGISISFDCAMCRICFRITFSNSACGGGANSRREGAFWGAGESARVCLRAAVSNSVYHWSKGGRALFGGNVDVKGGKAFWGAIRRALSWAM